MHWLLKLDPWLLYNTCDLLFLHLHLLAVDLKLPLSLFKVLLLPPVQETLVLLDTAAISDQEPLFFNQLCDVVLVVWLLDQLGTLIKECLFFTTL